VSSQQARLEAPSQDATAVLYLFADEPVVAQTTGGRALVRLNGLVKRTAGGSGAPSSRGA
jgi:hypothetical protein